MDQLFKFHKLNKTGIDKAKLISVGYDTLLDRMKLICPESREFSIAKTKLEESCFYAKKAMANAQENLEIDQGSEESLSEPSDSTISNPGEMGRPGDKDSK